MRRPPEAHLAPGLPLLLGLSLLVLVPALADASLVLDWSPDPVELTDHFEASELAAWKAHANQLRAISLTRTGVSLAYLCALLFTPFGAWLWGFTGRVSARLGRSALFQNRIAERIAAVARRIFGEDWAASLSFAYGFFFLQMALMLPLRAVAEVLRKSEGISNYTAGAWVWDVFKAEVMAAIVFAFLIFGLFGLIRRVPRWWWLLLGLPTGLLLFGYGVVAPYRARVFSEFSPLKDPGLEQKLTALARAEGLELTAIKVIDASRTTRALNAYITGVGPSRELVIFDTLLAAMSPEEVTAVVAHELGHHRRRDILLRYGLSATFVVVGLAVLAPLLRRGSRRFGFDGPGDVRNLPWLLLLYALFNLVARPATQAYGRYEERQADLAALQIYCDPEATTGMMVKLARANHADVDPPGWALFWFGSHPALVDRIGVARKAARWGSCGIGTTIRTQAGGTDPSSADATP